MENSKYKPTIGIEVHAELATKSKMFCGCRNDPNEKRPNVNICPICTAQPGALPVINKQAVEMVVKFGLAVGGTIADFSEFDRKNYFYPDLPKGFQISQYKYPIVTGGKLAGVELTRVHLEEDTARSQHADGGEKSLIDFNRSSVPLMELVTEPVIHSAKEAANFAKELQLLLWYLGVSEANMEKGEMRVEANISVSNEAMKLGTKVEVKNLNSFRAMERAIDYEIKRQIKAIETGENVVQETRGWNEAKQETYSQRKKEDSHDYRYFPEPDLPKLKLHSIFDLEKIKTELPELPWQKRERFVEEYGITRDAAELFVAEIKLGSFFEKVTGLSGSDKKKAVLASNYISSDVVSLIKAGENEEEVTPENFAELINMITENKISSRGAKDILTIMYKLGGDPEVIAKESNLLQKSDAGVLEGIVENVILANRAVVAEFKNGKEASLQFLIGQGMKASRGSANPIVLKELLIKKIQS